MATYRIIAKTNGYIANRDIQFNGRTEIIVERELALKEAYKMLLDMFNEKYADNEEVGLRLPTGVLPLSVHASMWMVLHLHSVMVPDLSIGMEEAM